MNLLYLLPRVPGTGPEEGWISIALSGAGLLCYALVLGTNDANYWLGLLCPVVISSVCMNFPKASQDSTIKLKEQTGSDGASTHESQPHMHPRYTTCNSIVSPSIVNGHNRYLKLEAPYHMKPSFEMGAYSFINFGRSYLYIYIYNTYIIHNIYIYIIYYIYIYMCV